jgi:hypothetical protein
LLAIFAHIKMLHVYKTEAVVIIVRDERLLLLLLLYVSVYVCVCMDVCVCLCICECMCVCVYVLVVTLFLFFNSYFVVVAIMCILFY